MARDFVVSDASASARKLAAELGDSLHRPGLALAAAMNDQIVARVEWGWADVEKQTPVSTASQFRIGSVSKLLTATAAVRLHQKGLLDLDAPIGRYVAGLPADKATITARQLAGHLAGIRHYGRDDFISRTRYRDVTESLNRFVSDPLVPLPAAQYAYSSYGYNLLGAVLQGASRKEFRRVVVDEVLTPLDMRNTAAEDAANPPPQRARLYSRDAQGALVDAAAADLTDRWPSGGYLSTAADLARFGVGVLRSGFLTADARALLFTSQRTARGDETGVGLGWRIGRDSLGRRFVHHGGDALGGRAFLLVYLDQGIAVALVTNLSFAPIGEKEAMKLADLCSR